MGDQSDQDTRTKLKYGVALDGSVGRSRLYRQKQPAAVVSMLGATETLCGRSVLQGAAVGGFDSFGYVNVSHVQCLQ